MSIIDKMKDIYRGENAIFNRLPQKLTDGVTTSIRQGNAAPAAKAILMGAANPYFEWKERAENFYGTPKK